MRKSKLNQGVASFYMSAILTNSLSTYAFIPVLIPHMQLQQRIFDIGWSRICSSEKNTLEDNFHSLGLTDELVGITEKMGWKYPTAVQTLSIPAILDIAHREVFSHTSEESNSLWCEGPTGSGKTAGFVLPIIQLLLKSKQPDNNLQVDRGHVTTLILSPTRELAAQTASVIQNLLSHLPKGHRSRISVEVMHGGVPIEPQISTLAKIRQNKKKLDFLVATPGRLVDLLKHRTDDPTMAALNRRILDAFEEKSNKKTVGQKGRRKSVRRAESSLTLNDIQEMNLDRVDDDGRGTLNELLLDLDYLVLDEADRLLAEQFKDDIDGVISLLSPKDRKDLKVFLFSATFPEKIELTVNHVLSQISSGVPRRVSTSAAMMQRVQSDDNTAQPSRSKEKRLMQFTPITSVAPDSGPKIKHRAIRLNKNDRTQALRHILEKNNEVWDRVLVFVATRYASEHVAKKLCRYGVKAVELHGKLDQEARERRLQSFRSGTTRVLVSTDLAARGIDVEGLSAVINYDLPRGTADVTHRVGRTGRAGKEGTAITFITASKASHFDLIEKKELHGYAVEREVLSNFVPNEAQWELESMVEQSSVPGAVHSQRGLAHDRMFGGIKGRRKSKKDKLREAALITSGEERL